LHNGDVWWKQLLRTAGYAKLGQTLLGIPSHDLRLERLLALLGMPLRTALLEHTHLPYVMAFNSARHEGLHDGPQLPDASTRTSAVLPVAAGAHARFCPECLAQDFDEHEPHWRLSHQLPNVFYCSAHDTRLLDACPSCRMPVNHAAPRLVDPLPCICSCGHDLGKRLVESPSEPELLRRIRQLSVDAQRSKGRWPGDKVATLLRQRFLATEAPTFVDFVACDDEGYPTTKVDSQVHIHHEGSDATVVVRKTWYKFGAPDLCVTMAKLRLTFGDAEAALDQVVVTPKKTWKHVIDRDTMRRRLDHYVERWRRSGLIHPKKCAAFWYFALNDPSHLNSYPGLDNVVIPSIKEDRDLLVARLMGRRRTALVFNQRLHGQPPLYMRMTLRDAVWLDKVRRRFVTEVHGGGEDGRELRVDRIRKAIESLMNSGDRPGRITATLIARYSQMSTSRVGKLVAETEELAKLVTVWNAEQPERACRWAIAALRDEGVRLTAWAVACKARGDVQQTIPIARRLLGLGVTLQRLDPSVALFGDQAGQPQASESVPHACQDALPQDDAVRV
jgi:hypothetical protein